MVLLLILGLVGMIVLANVLFHGVISVLFENVPLARWVILAAAVVILVIYFAGQASMSSVTLFLLVGAGAVALFFYLKAHPEKLGPDERERFSELDRLFPLAPIPPIIPVIADVNTRYDEPN